MNDTQKKEMGSFIGGGGVGFLVGYFWPRKKAGGGSGIELSNLVIDPPNAPYSEAATNVTISVDAVNNGPAIDVDIVAQFIQVDPDFDNLFGNVFMPTAEHFEAGESRTITWNRQLQNAFDCRIIIYVNPIEGVFRSIHPS
ncbi:MAG: hypothetical protein PHI12_07370 [Dehalococcoidales bacterium]|nr:hypothetical protein [Dehalococcoidales bacterium]